MLLLETLPGWPEAPDFSTLSLLMLTVIGPVIACVVIGALVFAPQWVRRGTQTESTEVAVRSED